MVDIEDGFFETRLNVAILKLRNQIIDLITDKPMSKRYVESVSKVIFFSAVSREATRFNNVLRTVEPCYITASRYLYICGFALSVIKFGVAIVVAEVDSGLKTMLKSFLDNQCEVKEDVSCASGCITMYFYPFGHCVCDLDIDGAVCKYCINSMIVGKHVKSNFACDLFTEPNYSKSCDKNGRFILVGDLNNNSTHFDNFADIKINTTDSYNGVYCKYSSDVCVTSKHFNCVGISVIPPECLTDHKVSLFNIFDNDKFKVDPNTIYSSIFHRSHVFNENLCTLNKYFLRNLYKYNKNDLPYVDETCIDNTVGLDIDYDYREKSTVSPSESVWFGAHYYNKRPGYVDTSKYDT
jgi:hypothetical protein